MFSKVIQKVIVFFLKVVFFPLVRLIWIKQVTGIENIPKTGKIIIAFNHQSYFDFIGFMAITPRPIYYLAAGKFYTKDTHWLWGYVLDATGQVRVDRTNKDKQEVYKTVERILQQDKALGIFPEGTRVASKTNMQQGFTGVAKFAIANDVTVIPVGIKGSYDILSRSDKLPKFKKILEFNIGKSVTFDKYVADTVNLQSATNLLMEKIAKLSGKIYPYG